MTIDNKSNYFFTMTRHYQSLQDIMDSGKMNVELIFRVGHQLLSILESTHQAFLTYNDLKPSNILLNKECTRVTLIDFGFATPFQISQDCHISEKMQKFSFQGNLLYGSTHQMNFKYTSRRDDLISLAYLLMTLLNGNYFPLLDIQIQHLGESTQITDGIEDVFEKVKAHKSKHSLQSMAESLKIDNAQSRKIQKFVRSV